VADYFDRDYAAANRTPFEQVEGIARKTRVPVNVLLAIGEKAGVKDGQELVTVAQRAAQELGPEIAKGGDIKQIIRQVAGKDADSFLARARQIGQELYPDQFAAAKATAQPADEPSALGDAARSFGAGLASGVGAAVEGVGALADAPLAAMRGDTAEPGLFARAGRAGGDALRDLGESMRSGMSQEARDAIEQSMPSGDLFKPETWSVGESPSLKGYMLLGADVLGSFLPVVAAGILGGGVGGIAVGGAQSAGAGAEQARGIIEEAFLDRDENGVSTLERESAYFRDLRAQGMGEAAALKKTQDAASFVASLITAPIGAFGGAATSAIMRGALPAGLGATGGIARQAAVRGAIGAGEEGFQEALEGVAARFGTQVATDLPLDLTQDTFGDFLLGALGGGPVGAAAGAGQAAAQRFGGAQPQDDEVDPWAGVDSTAPIQPQPAPQGAAPQEPRPGSLAHAALEGARRAGTAPQPNTGPAMVSPKAGMLGGDPTASMGAEAARPAQEDITEQPIPVNVRIADGTEFQGEIIAQNDTAIEVMDPNSGEVYEFPVADIQDGLVQIAGVQPSERPAPPAEPGVDDAASEALREQGFYDGPWNDPVADPLAGISAEEAARRLSVLEEQARQDGWDKRSRALRDRLMQIAGQGQPAPAPVEAVSAPAQDDAAPLGEVGAGVQGATPPATSQPQEVMRKDGTPFKTVDTARQRMRNLKLNQADYDIQERDGGFVAVLKGTGATDAAIPDGIPASDQADAETGDAVQEAGQEIAPVAGQQQQKTDSAQPPAGPTGGRDLPDATETGQLDAALNEQQIEAQTTPITGATDGIRQGNDQQGLRDQGRGQEEVAQTPARPTIGPMDPERAKVRRRETNAVLDAIEAGSNWQGTLDGRTVIVRPGKARVRVDGQRENDIIFDTEGMDRNEVETYLNGAIDQAERRAPSVAGRDPVSAALAAGIEKGKVEHVTQKGKTLTGYVVRGITDEQAKAIDPYMLKKNGGHFVRAERADMFEGMPKAPAAQAPQAEPETPTAEQFDQIAAQTNPTPTPAQAEAENYKTGKTDWRGLKLSIENRKGTERRKVGPDGKTEWSVTMPAHYGRILRTEGADGDHVDFYMGDNPESDQVFVVDQMDAETGGFDEHKVMLGFNTQKEAKDAYLAGFSDGKGKQRWGGVTPLSVKQLAHELTKERAFKQPFSAPAQQKDSDAKRKPAKANDEKPVPIKPIEIPAEGFLRPGYERVMVNGKPSTDQTRMTDDGYVVVRKINNTTIRGPQGQVIWAGAYDVNEATVDAEIGKARDRRAKDAPKAKGWQSIGTNARGKPLFEDDRGVRSYTDGGVRLTESVGIIPGQGISINKDERGRDYLTKEEWDAKNPQGGQKQQAEQLVAEANEKAAKGYRIDLDYARANIKVFGPDDATVHVDTFSSISALKDALDRALNIIANRNVRREDAPKEPTRDQFEGNEEAALAQGKADFARGVGRKLPSYIDPTDTVAGRAWYRGWDQANLNAFVEPLPPAKTPAEAPQAEAQIGKRLTTVEEGKNAGAAFARAGKAERSSLDPAMGNASGDAIGGWTSGYRRVKQAQEAGAKAARDGVPMKVPGWAVGTPFAQDFTKAYEAEKAAMAAPSAASILDQAFDDVFGAADAAPEPAPKVAAKPAANSVTLPEAVESALEAQLEKKKDRVKRLRSSGKPGLQQAEADLRKMRQEIFEAEEAAAQAIADGDPSLFDRFAGAFPDAAEAIRDEIPSPAPRTAGQAASSAAQNIASGASDIVAGLNALFGDPNKLGSGLSFDAETYAKAKPLFISAVRKFGQAGQDILDIARAMVRGLMEQGLQREAQQNMRPYLERFITDVQNGTIDPFADAAPSGNVDPTQESEAAQDDLSPETDDQGGVASSGAGGRNTASPKPTSGTNSQGGSGSAGGRGNEGANANDQLESSLVGSGAGISQATGGVRSGESPGNFVIDPDFPLGQGTDGEKIAANMAALRLVKQLDAENRYATPAEQAVLARYVGWGGLKRVFDPRVTGQTNQWGRAQAELKELVTREDYAAMRRSTENAHFTSRTVVNAMWKAMQRFGFSGGRALEPTVGTGNFLGLMPADLSGKTDWFAAELDNVTGAIAKHLYPDATVMDGMGFQDAPFRAGSMDVAIGNPPFSSDIISSDMHPEIPPMSLHNYIIAKTGLLLREGGIMGMVVTNRFMDLPNQYARSYLARNFDFIGAVRLPNTAFKANAGTEVTTDIVWFQKRREGDPRGDLSWLEAGAQLPGTDVTLNSYFARNPDMMLGRPGMDGTMRGSGPEFTLHDDGRDLATALDQALAKLKATLPDRIEALQDAVVEQSPVSDMDVGDFQLGPDDRIMMRGIDARDGSIDIREVTPETPWGPGSMEMERIIRSIEGTIETATNGTMDARKAQLAALAGELREAGLLSDKNQPMKSTPTGFGKALDPSIAALADAINADTPFFGREQKAALKVFQAELSKKALGKRYDALKGMLDLRRRFINQLRAEREDAPNIDKMRADLRKAYTNFVKAHGYVNSPANAKLVADRPGVEFGLEEKYTPADKAEGIEESATPASILRKRLIEPYSAPDRADNAADGMHLSLRERGRLDLPYIAKLTGQDVAAVKQELTTGEKPLVFFDPKLEEYVIADEYLSGNLMEKLREAERSGMEVNVRALTAAMPPKKTREQVAPSIRSQWMPISVFTDFMAALGVTSDGVSYIPEIGKIIITRPSDGTLTAFGEQFKTKRVNVSDVFEAAVAGKAITIYDRTVDDKLVKNTEETKKANVSVQRMSEEFEKWAYANPERARQIVDAFNEKVNVIKGRQFDGVSYLRMVGANPHINPRDTQKNGAWRMIQQARTMMHHVVGAGKTITAIIAIMERKRLGLSKKAMVVVPNHIVEQWGREFRELYPGANLLVAHKDDFSKARRRKMFARIASGDYDAVIIGHSQLRQIENSDQEVRAIIEEQVDALEKALDAAKASGESKRTAKQIQSRLDKLEEQLRELNDKTKGDDIGITFADMGIDNIVVDEAHEFKNLQYATGGDRIVGMNSPAGSERAFDLYVKLRGLQARNGATHFLTGTPVSNSLIEIYTMMKYLGYETLKSMNIDHFDAWSSTFIKDENRIEFTPAMTLKERRVIRGVVNAEALSRIYKNFSDILMRPDIERIYAQQVEKENKAKGENKSTRFPTPKVKGGGRQLVIVPSGPLHQEFTQYLVMRAEGIARNNPKTYAATDNMLWVLSDARKASIDIRTIDPRLPRIPDSKVVYAGKKLIELYKRYNDVKGTQLVFADSSVPMAKAKKDLAPALVAGWQAAGFTEAEAKARVKADDGKVSALAQYEAITEEIDRRMQEGDFNSKQQDRAEAWVDSSAADELRGMAMTSDYGFSFYDDLRAYLVEQGIPEREVAFIHEHDTPQKKSDLFAAVNAGDVRVLIGSTFKMGAGTNVQQRAVALHHIDAPWRPSDMEQREGRVIRQGNELYKADPDGFEVEIYAYTMEKSSDTVLWQVLERKASGIESFMRSTSDTVMEEGDGDADSYAAFMAQSTGNRVFIDKMKAEKDLLTEQSAISNAAMIKGEAENWLGSYDQRRKDMAQVIKERQGAADAPVINGDAGQTYRDYDDAMLRFDAAKEAHDVEVEKVRAENEALPKGEKKKLLPKFLMERPVIYPDGAKLDPWAAKIKEALEELKNAPRTLTFYGTGFSKKSIPIHQSYVLQITYWEDTEAYVAEITANDYRVVDLGRATAKDILSSRAMMQALRPENIKAQFERIARNKRRELSELESLKPEMERKASAQVDYSKVRDLEQRVAMLTGQTRLAEVEAAKDRIGKPNRFAAMDDKGRDLAGENSENAPFYAGAKQEPFTVQIAGKTFTAPYGARAGIDIQGQNTFDRVWLDGQAEDGERRLIELRTKTYGEKETPDAGMMKLGNTNLHIKLASSFPLDVEGRESRFDPDLTPALAREVTRSVNAEMKRSGLDGKVTAQVVKGLVNAAGRPIQGRQRGATIEVNPDSADGVVGTLRHEIVHALRDGELWGKPYGLFTQAEWQGLVAAARRDPALMARIERDYPDYTKPEQLEEGVAELYRLWARNMDQRSGLGRAFQKMRAFFQAMANALRGAGFQSEALTFERIASGAIGGRGPDGPGGGGRRGAAESRTDITQTKAFRDWFKDSKVVDAEGKPLVVYHATDADFEAFDFSKLGRVTRANATSEAAGVMAEVGVWTNTRDISADTMQDRALPLYVSLQNPLEISFSDLWSMAEGYESGDAMRAALESDGYDGLAVDDSEFGGTSFVAFYPTQIKSVNNRGAFNPSDPRIMESRFDPARRPDGRFATKAGEYSKALLADGGPITGAKERNILGRFLTDMMGGKSDTYNTLALVPGEPLFQELGKNLPSAQKYLGMKHAMSAMRNERQAKAAGLIDEWRGFMTKHQKANTSLMELMHDATIAGVDPAEPFVVRPKGNNESRAAYASFVEGKRAQYDELRERFIRIPKQGQEIYRKARDAYTQMAEDERAIIMDNVQKAMELNLKRAQKQFEDDMREIEEDGLTGAEREAKEAEAMEKLARVKKSNGYGRKSRLAALRLMFEQNTVDAPYFPLLRHGNYYVTVKNQDGKVISFTKAESEKDQQRIARELARDYPDAEVKVGVMSSGESGRAEVDPTFVADVEAMIGASVADPQLMDAIWQRYLETLPDFSIRKSRLHRKGTPGYTTDAFRNYARQMFHGAHQLARLKYGQDMQMALDDARREADEADDPNRAVLVVNEMYKRHEWTMNPKNAAWSTWATSAAFVYYLGATPAAALVNLSQSVVVGIPVLAAAFEKGTVAGAARHLGRGLREFAMAKGGMLKSKSLKPDERAALQRAYDAGVIEKSQAHDLAGMADSGVEYSDIRAKIMRPISWMFHQAEVLNREITFMAAYRMARENQRGLDQAYADAARLTWKTHFNYENDARPRLQFNDTIRVATTFRNFQLNMLWRLFRDTHQAFEGATEADRKEARAQLIGITGMMMLTAGFTGTWGYALLTTLVGMFFPGGADEVEEEIKGALVNTLGRDMAGMILKGVPGHLTGIDLSSRIGMAELWFRRPDRMQEGQDLYNHWIEQLLGPVVAIGGNAFRGAAMVADGQVYRGIETAVPKAMRDILRAGRYQSEGVTTMNGNPILEDVAPIEALTQALGFTPARVSERYQTNRFMRNEETRIRDERTRLMAQAFQDVKQGGPLSDRTMKAIREFNAQYPSYPITAQTLRQSFQSRLRGEAQTVDGLRLNPRLDAQIRAPREAAAIYQ
jgi:N12 class adenine-specific DNA methylase